MTGGPNYDKLVGYRMAEAAESLAAARLALDHELYRSAVNRAYYAAFYAASAVLLLAGQQPAKLRESRPSYTAS